jgi:hypothetical protein
MTSMTKKSNGQQRNSLLYHIKNGLYNQKIKHIIEVVKQLENRPIYEHCLQIQEGQIGSR